MNLNQHFVLAWSWDVHLFHIQLVQAVLARLPLLQRLRRHLRNSATASRKSVQFRNFPISEYVDVDRNELEDEVVKVSEFVLLS